MKIFSTISLLFTVFACSQAYSMADASRENFRRVFRSHRAKFKNVLEEMHQSPKHTNNFVEPAQKQPQLLCIKDASKRTRRSRIAFKKKLYTKTLVLPVIAEVSRNKEESQSEKLEDRVLFSPRTFKLSQRGYL